MRISTLGKSLTSLISAAQFVLADYDTTICDTTRFGELNDTRMYYPNAWNPKSPDDGFICMKVDNSTAAYDATWNWDEDIQDVHSFPYVRFSHPDLPMRLSNLTSIRLATNWIYTPGSPDEPPRDFSDETWHKNKAELESSRTITNAAWDFFLDDDRNRTLYAQDAAIEFMVWLGRVGDPWWLGRKEGGLLSYVTLGSTEFSLYYGRNSGGTHVFTAVTRNGDDVLSLDEDFYPLFEYILKEAHDHSETPEDLPKDPYLGIVEFGTETWLSGGNVTFTAANFDMKINEDDVRNKTNSTTSTPKDGSDDSNNSQDLDDSDSGSDQSTNSTNTEDDEDAASSARTSVFGVMIPAFLIIMAVFN